MMPALAALLLAGCSAVSATWYDTRRVPGYVVKGRVPIVVDISERALEADDGGYIGAMVFAVSDELGKRGIESTIIADKPARPPSPRVELIVRDFEEGDFAAAYASQVGMALTLGIGLPLAGSSEFIVLCKAFSPSDQLMFEGVIQAGAPGTTNSSDAAEAVGATIAKGLTDPKSTRPRPTAEDPRN